MRAVTKEQFYSAVGRLNVHPQIQPGPYPYTSIWKTVDERRVVGKSVGKCVGGITTTTYFLNDGR